MSRRAVESVFDALFTLTEIRALLRTTAPEHRFIPPERERAESLIRDLEDQVASIRKELLT
ncbi:MAG: hypothetical protein NT074_06340 [Methanomicrobiales archaeon]|nr:hypothetical protein [Methanomicrobiales archaeon]